MHCLVIVFIPADSPDIYSAVNDALAPTNCELEVEEYEESCYCFGNKAYQAAHLAAVKAGGTYPEIGQRFENTRREQTWNERHTFLCHEADKRELTDSEAEEWGALIEKSSQLYDLFYEPYNRAYYDTFQNHPLKDKPDPDCEFCGGTGKTGELTDLNPQAQWDYWSIGGRFDGRLQTILDYREKKAREVNKEADVESASSALTESPVETSPQMDSAKFEWNPFKRISIWWKRVLAEAELAEQEKKQREEDPEGYRGNVFRADELSSEFFGPYAAVTPDGVWHEYAESPSLPMKEKAEARQAADKHFQNLLDTYSDHLVVVCDVHT